MFEIDENYTVKIKIFTKKADWVNKDLLRCIRLKLNARKTFLLKQL